MTERSCWKALDLLETPRVLSIWATWCHVFIFPSNRPAPGGQKTPSCRMWFPTTFVWGSSLSTSPSTMLRYHDAILCVGFSFWAFEAALSPHWSISQTEELRTDWLFFPFFFFSFLHQLTFTNTIKDSVEDVFLTHLEMEFPDFSQILASVRGETLYIYSIYTHPHPHIYTYTYACVCFWQHSWCSNR